MQAVGRTASAAALAEGDVTPACVVRSLYCTATCSMLHGLTTTTPCPDHTRCIGSCISTHKSLQHSSHQTTQNGPPQPTHNCMRVAHAHKEIPEILVCRHCAVLHPDPATPPIQSHNHQHTDIQAVSQVLCMAMSGISALSATAFAPLNV